MCKLLLSGMVENTGRVKQLANGYIEGKADEYSNKRAWSSIGSGGQSTQIKYLSKSTDTYNKILLQ